MERPLNDFFPQALGAPNVPNSVGASPGVKRKRKKKILTEMDKLRTRFEDELNKKNLDVALSICVEQRNLKLGLTMMTSPDFKSLKAACAVENKAPCSSCFTIKPCTEFKKNSKAANSMRHCCKVCDNDPVVLAANEVRRTDTRAAKTAAMAALPSSKNTGAVEDAFVQWMKPKLEALQFVVVVMLEFRRADLLVRRSCWPEDTWVRLQAKADGGVQRGGRAPKPMKSRMQFLSCFGYGTYKALELVEVVHEGRMLMLCGGKRAGTLETLKHKEYTVWCFDGMHVNTPTLHSNTGTHTRLGGIRKHDPNGYRLNTTHGALRVCSMEEVAQRIDDTYTDPTFPKTSYLKAMLDVERSTQRKEMILMLCLRQALEGLEDVTFLPGNQTAIDCLIGLLSTQFKSYMFNQQAGHACHRDKGIQNIAYDVSDLVALFVIGFLVRCTDGRYFFFHARETGDEMLKKGRLSDKRNYVTAKTISFSPPLADKYHQWLWGRTVPQRDTEINLFAPPVEISPDDVLTKELLDEVCETPVDSTFEKFALDPHVVETCTSKYRTNPTAVALRTRRAKARRLAVSAQRYLE